MWLIPNMAQGVEPKMGLEADLVMLCLQVMIKTRNSFKQQGNANLFVGLNGCFMENV